MSVQLVYLYRIGLHVHGLKCGVRPLDRLRVDVRRSMKGVAMSLRFIQEEQSDVTPDGAGAPEIAVPFGVGPRRQALDHV